jgi:hypothetical protein
MDIFKSLLEMFAKTKDDKTEKILVGFKINKHLWNAYDIDCTSKGIKYPNKNIEKIIEDILAKEVKENKENENMAKKKQTVKKGGKK